MSKNCVSYEKLISLSKALRESWTNDKDKTEEMKELTNILKDINSKSSIEQYFNNNEKEINFFKNTFIDNIVQIIISQSYVIGKDGDDIALDLLFQIYKLFPTFHKKNYSEIFESIRKIFKDPHNIAFFFPQNKINKPGTASNFKKRYNYSKFNSEFCSEFKNNNTPLAIYNVGDIVDILIDYKDSRTDIDKNAWVRGKIKKIENGLYYIEYNGEETEITFHIGSNKVQPKGKKTSDWDWRTNLKKYDLVDVYDREAWWPCTIYDIIEKTDKNGIKRVKYKIGFRLYLNHFKNVDEPEDTFLNHASFWNNSNAQADIYGEEFIGDGDERDEEIDHFSKRIQQFNSYSEIQKQSKEGGDLQILDNIKEELTNDIITEETYAKDLYLYRQYNKKNIIVGKSDNFSYYFACLLKKMENDGDFEKFIDIITDNPNKEELLTIITIYYNSLNYIHPQYFEDNKEVIKKEFMNYIEFFDDNEIKNVSDFIDLGRNFLSKIYEKDNPKEKISIEGEIELKYAFKKIKTTNFEKRLNGIKLLNNFINKIKKQNNNKVLENICREIKKSKIIDEIFGANYHSQIISKSTDLVKLFFEFKIADKNDLKLIWSCTQKGDSEVKKIIIKLLIELTPIFDEVFIGNLLNAMIAVSDGKPNEKETDFVFSLSSETKNQENKMKICKYCCRIIFNLNSFSCKNPVFEKLIKLMDNDENYLIKVLEICEDQIKENKHTLICNSLILELFKHFIKFNPNQEPPYQCLKDSLNNFLKDEHLIKIFEENFTNYINIVKEKLKSPNIKTVEEIFIDGFNHKNNIDGRLAFLLSIIKIYPNYDFIYKLKELLIDNPAAKEDNKYFFTFMSRYCFPMVPVGKENKNEKKEILDQTKIKLFNIFAEKDQTEMSYFQFKLFINAFLYLNKDQLDYQIIQKDGDECDYDIKLKKNKTYKEIKEIDILWKIMFKVKEEKVLYKLINVIYQMVHDEESIIIHNIISNNETDQNDAKFEKCYKLLKIFLIESEKNVVIDIKSHNSLLKNAIIRLPLELSNENYDNNITELFYDNTSLNEIKEFLMKKYKIPMEYIEVILHKDDHKIKLDYTYNNKSLKEIIIDDLNKKNEIKNIKINKKLSFIKKSVDINDLITSNKQLSPKFKNIIKDWYEEFTKDSAVMKPINFASLISKMTNTHVTERDQKVINIFTKYDTAENGFLTEDNFCQYYLDYISEYNSFNIIWNNLNNMGYDEYLCKKDDPLEVNHIENNNLFRYRLSNEDFIDAFIDHYNNYYSTYPEIDYDFIFYLPTNIDIYKKVLFNLNSNNFNLFDNIFGNDENILKQLYYLIIIESILQDIEIKNIDIKRIFKNPNNSIQELCSNKYEPFESIEIEQKIQFVEDFIKSKNYEKLIKYNIDMLNEYRRHQNEPIKKCFRKSLKIIRIIFESFLEYNHKNKYKTLIDDNIYFLDYSHINNALKDKNEIKEIINNYSFSNVFRVIMNYLLKYNNIVDELYNDCFDIIIKFLAFKDKLLDEFISDDKKKKNFYDLIINNLSFNSLALVKSLTDTLKKLSYISFSSDNKFILFLYDIMDSVFNSKDNNNIFLSDEFFDFFTQINDSIYNTEKDPNNTLLLKIIDMLINNINEKDKEKKLKKEIFIKYIELLIRLIEKNSKIRKQISSYTVNNETLSSILEENIIFGEYDSKENNKNVNQSKNQDTNDNKDFILIGKSEDDEDENSINEILKQTCLNYILSCLKDKNDINAKREIIKLNKIRKDKKSNDLSDSTNNNNTIITTNQNKRNINDYIKALKVCGHVGLRNLGSTCYMNSIMQQLYMVPTFRYAIMGANDNDSINPNLRYGDQDDNLLHQLQVMFSYLNLSEKQFFEPKYFCHSFKDIDGQPTNPKIQQDSMEFYINFCDQIEKLLAKTKYKYIINDVFMGKTCSSVICDSCHHISNTFENIYNLSLEVKNINSLNDSLQKLIVPEIIEGYKCDGCHKNVKVKK